MPENNNATERRTGEYAGLTSDQQKSLQRQRSAYEISEEFCKPYFDKFLRMSNLYHRVIPEELDFTLSKVMLAIPFSIVQNEVPRHAAMLFSQEEFFRMHANDPMLEESASAVQAWLTYQARERNRIFPRIMPTLIRQCIYGTAWRVVTHSPRVVHKTQRAPSRSVAGIPVAFEDQSESKQSMGIHAQNVDIWSVMPSPNSRFINTLDNEDYEAAEWVHWIDYMSKSKLEKMKSKRGMNKNQIERMFEWVAKGQRDENKIDQDYKLQAQPSAIDENTSSWLDKVRAGDKEGIEARYRCIWTFFRDQWILVGEGQFVLYDGPPLLDWFPVAAYYDTPDPDSPFGTGLLETCEDVILTKLMNFNFRQDYLAGTLHPSTFIRDEIVSQNGGNLADFDPQPYQTFVVPKKIQRISDAIWRDRFPDISPQAFQEDTVYNQLLQEIAGQPDYSKGMGGSGALANETATGITALIDEGNSRSMMRAMNIEYGGLHDELMLMLKWGKKYAFEDEYIRVASRDGFPWMSVPHEAITDGYGIELQGSRQLVHRNEMLKRMLTVLPMFLNNPNVPGQQELLRQTNEKFQLFDRPDDIFGHPGGQPMAGGMNPEAGMGGAQTMQNEGQAVAGATAVPPAALAV